MLAQQVFLRNVGTVQEMPLFHFVAFGCASGAGAAHIVQFGTIGVEHRACDLPPGLAKALTEAVATVAL
jgi:hypothetical protein